MPFTRGSKPRIHYQTHGDQGPWVVLLMGLGASSRWWLDYPERLAAHTTPFRVVTLDNRGTGQSAAPRGPYWMGDMADDAARVMDEVGIERGYVVGASMGGMIAQHLALRHGQRLDGLVLVSTTPGLPHGSLPTPRAMAALLAYGLGKSSRAEVLSSLILARAQRHRAQEIQDLLFPIYQADATPPLAFLSQLLGCMLHSTTRHLHRIAVPTIVVTGDDDILIRPRNSRVLAARIPGAILEVIPDAGHGAPFADPMVIPRALERLHAARSR